MAIPKEGIVIGTVSEILSDVRRLAWLTLDELNEATTEDRWDVPRLVAGALAFVAVVLYAEPIGKAETDALIATMPASVRGFLDRLERNDPQRGGRLVARGRGQLMGRKQRAVVEAARRKAIELLQVPYVGPKEAPA